MEGERATDAERTDDGLLSTPLKRMTDKTRNSYFFLLILTVAVMILGLIYDSLGEVIVAAPVIFLLITAILYDKEFIHIPPTMLVMVVTIMYVAIAGKIFFEESGILDFVTYALIGMLTGLCGIIVSYVSLGKMPGFADEKPALIALEAFCFGITSYVIWIIITFYFGTMIGYENLETVQDIVARFVTISFGCLIVSILFFIDKHTHRAVVGFLSKNSDTIGIDSESEMREIVNMIGEGESDVLEFKSTLRTNLQTGEKDKRMEKAALKTLVAFLNSNGGTLLIGVGDDGDVLGMDIEAFETRDKLNLHVTNLISSQIGDEFIPFIRYRMIDIEDKPVLRFTCKPTQTPVFLKNDKMEIYYVRSGPSSVELSGIDLIKYVNNRGKMKKRKFIAQTARMSE